MIQFINYIVYYNIMIQCKNSFIKIHFCGQGTLSIIVVRRVYVDISHNTSWKCLHVMIGPEYDWIADSGNLRISTVNVAYNRVISP